MRAIGVAYAREIARKWYSPDHPALVALATMNVLYDHLVVDLVREVESTITWAIEHGYSTRDIDELERLLRWAQVEARTRGLE